MFPTTFVSFAALVKTHFYFLSEPFCLVASRVVTAVPLLGQILVSFQKEKAKQQLDDV